MCFVSRHEKHPQNFLTKLLRFCSELRADSFLIPPGCLLTWDQVGMKYRDLGSSMVRNKYLANDGLIKLNVAEKFEDSEVVQYHATAAPDFRDGKFQL